VRKRSLFPDRVGFDDSVLRLRMRELTEWLVLRHTDFGSLEAYFDGYSIAGDRLASLSVPASILTSVDDPVIPVDDFHRLRLPAQSRLEVSRWGGHCGFIEGPRLDGYAERWVIAQLAGTQAQ
jgi:predicted alpha/beta-fold hydrolase